MEHFSYDADQKLCKWNKGDILCRLIQALTGYSNMRVNINLLILYFRQEKYR